MAVNLPNSKLGNNASSPASSPATSQIGPSLSSDGTSRRSGGSGSFGAGSSSRAVAQPRKQQGSKNQHKHSRRCRLTDEDAIAESAAMRSFTNKKGQTSITHLMNFSLPPRPTSHYQPNYQRQPHRAPRWGLGSGYHAVDKARYVHANYRFIVDPRGDYTQQSTDADVYLEWSSILQILASPLSQQAACPICLSDPVAPRMAKCGHIFCLHCLIRYMHSGDAVDHFPEKKSRWKSCPICWDSMYMSDMRAVRWFKGQESELLREGGDIVLRLVVRPADSTLALPKDASATLMKGEEIPWHFAADVMDFARVMRGTRDYMLEQYDEEIRELEQLERHDELMFGDDNEWTQKAIRSCQDAKERTRSMEVLLSSMATSSSQLPHDRDSDAMSNPASALSKSIAEYRAQSHTTPGPSDYHFYQALQHYYLSSLDIRILKASFGSYAAFPSTILPRVERISTGHIVDDELLRRYKYLAHLPHGCEVAFLECDWTDTVPKEVLEHFSSELGKRRKRNLEKDAREEKERVRAEKEEDEKRWREARRTKRGPSIDGRRDGLSLEGFQPLTPAEVEQSRETEAQSDIEGTSPAWGHQRDFGGRASGSGFGALASPSTSPSAARTTVWGTAAIAPTGPPVQAEPEPEQDDGWLQDWEKELLDHDVNLVEQMEGVRLDDSGPSNNTPASSGKKKGKKRQKITLMSTSQRRGL